MAQKLLVTGAAGFIGSQFVESCNRKRVEVISVDHLAHFSSRKEHDGIDFGTLVDREQLFNWLKDTKPDLSGIVHMGACTRTTELDEDFLKRVNLEYSQSIWKYASDHKIPLVYASSAATYGAGELGYNDDEALTERLKPLNPYGESKRLFDLWALEQERKGSSPPAWSGFKFFNVYGFGERHKKSMASVILHACDQINATGKVRLFKSHRPGIADGEQKRDFIYVGDVVKVLEFAMQKPIRRSIFNLGTAQARSFLDLAKAVFGAMARPEAIEFIDTPEAIRSRYQYFTEAKMDKLRNEGYAGSFISLEDGIRQYVARLIN